MRLVAKNLMPMGRLLNFGFLTDLLYHSIRKIPLISWRKALSKENDVLLALMGYPAI